MFFFLPSSFLALAMQHTMLGCGGCRAVREMASHLMVHAILSKWPLTQYCTNLKMAVSVACTGYVWVCVSPPRP